MLHSMIANCFSDVIHLNNSDHYIISLKDGDFRVNQAVLRFRSAPADVLAGFMNNYCLIANTGWTGQLPRIELTS